LALNLRGGGPRAIFSTYSRGERIADGVIHVLGVTAGCVGVAVLMAVALTRESALLTLSLALYGSGLLAMLTFSALYHTTDHPARRALLQRVDHAAIFVMIAGSYTPFALLKIGGPLGWSLVGFVWLAAAGAAAVKLLRPQHLEGRTVIACLLLAWIAVLGSGPLTDALPGWTLALLAAGGGLYSVGVVFHLWRRLAFHKAIWHGFVLAGASCHYVAVLGAVALPGSAA
jgi:hemolysin III